MMSDFLRQWLRTVEEPRYDLSANRETVIAGIRQMLDELHQAQEFDIREIGDSLYDGLFITDSHAKAIYVNRAYTKITGIKPEEVLGKGVVDLIDKGMFKNAVSEEVMKLKKQVNSVGEAIRTGTKMLITGNPILDEQGNVKKVVVIDRDISDLLAMRSELEASIEKIKAVEENQNKDKQVIEVLQKMHLNKNLIGHSVPIQQVAQMIEQVADLDVTVLIIGETGVGKEVVANEIYLNSKRKNDPFIRVNCAAIPANLMESELFGYEKGTFTGASSAGRMGMFELANKGMILLDEIGEMPISLQSKLLRVIQNKEVTRLGGRKPIELDVRIVAATNRDLKELVKAGKFREDLYYRLNVFPVYIPPLRERTDDIEELAQHFLGKYNAKYGKDIILGHQSMEALRRYSWPGNVREMQNVIERLVIIAKMDSIITAEQVGNLLNLDPYFTDLFYREAGLKEIIANTEKRAIENALKQCGSTRKAALLLKMDQANLVRKAQKLGISMGRKPDVKSTS